ncbi:hypothetical protein [Moraxella lacunata]|uniref:hypothetical protein n=1 Tax=Moraxella lacunata TaxID=477 RepID=UPI003EE388A1
MRFWIEIQLSFLGRIFGFLEYFHYEMNEHSLLKIKPKWQQIIISWFYPLSK